MMKNHVCWNPRAVRSVINPFAEHMPDSLFKAVHSDWALQVAPPIGKAFQEIKNNHWSERSPEQFLREFLDPKRPHVLAVILGETGSGKSHLVHWMRMHLPKNENSVVITVRKSGTSLRTIVREIIGRLPVDQQKTFLDVFNAAGDGSIGREGRMRSLLFHLAQSIREDSQVNRADELEEALLENLPDLLTDPYMQRAHFLRDGTVTEEIVDHIFSESSSKDRPDQRRVFVDGDIALGGMDFVHATKMARDAIKLIDLDVKVNIPKAIEIINRNLDKAIARTLSFSGDRIEELMSQLRIALKEQGKELILLVEEFARLQGIDRALLQAITSHGVSGEDELHERHKECKMRTAIAVTTGFFKSVQETAYARTTHIVDMNRSVGRLEKSGVTATALAEFSSRYLNAARLGLERIEKWGSEAGPGDVAPSRCETCSFRSSCHSVFGEVNGYGLYPFTEKALWNIASRVDQSMPDSLNPRVIQNNVLVEVLDTFAPDISAGEYPTSVMLKRFNDVRNLNLAEENKLANLNETLAPRWVAILELYDGSGQIHNVPAGIRSAFDCPEIPEIDEVSPGPTGPKKKDPERPPPPNPEELMIETWIRGDGLDQNLANKLRELLFSSILESIDWDILGISRAVFSGKTGKAFQRTSISFVRQTTRASTGHQVKLEIAANPKVGEALQGLLRASRNEFRWEFEGGESALVAYLGCVEHWTADVTRQLLEIVAPSGEWNSMVAAFELLSVGAALGGRMKVDGKIEEWLNSLFVSWGEEPSIFGKELRDIYGKVFKQRTTLIGIVRSQGSSMKGGQYGAMLDLSSLLALIEGVRKGKWKLTLAPSTDDISPLAKLYRDVQKGLEAAAKKEKEMRIEWLEEMETAFGQSASTKQILDVLGSTKHSVLEAGVAAQNLAKVLENALEQFGTVQFDDAMRVARLIYQAEDPATVLPLLGGGPTTNAMQSASALADIARRFVETVESNVETYGADEVTSVNEMMSSVSSIESSLREIGSSLRSLKFKQENGHAS